MAARRRDQRSATSRFGGPVLLTKANRCVSSPHGPDGRERADRLGWP
jgi:hypothetical protein